jgi:RNA polymerase sigma-70 factor (ECF subfamily)
LNRYAEAAGAYEQAARLTTNASEETDWRQIAALYEKLLQLNPSPVIALNHAVAVAMSAGIEDGLKRMDDLGHTGALDQYYLFHAARAELLRRLNRYAEAAGAYEQAARLTTNGIELDFLKRRLSHMEMLATTRWP